MTTKFRIGSVQLQVREPVAGVTLDAYVKCSAGASSCHQSCEDNALDQTSEVSVDQSLLRYRWYRAADTEHHIGSTVYCHIHPNRPAAFYCAFWKSELTPYGYIFPQACHCSLTCFQQHFHLQRRFWERAHSAKIRTAESKALIFEFGNISSGSCRSRRRFVQGAQVCM